MLVSRWFRKAFDCSYLLFLRFDVIRGATLSSAREGRRTKLDNLWAPRLLGSAPVIRVVEESKRVLRIRSAQPHGAELWSAGEDIARTRRRGTSRKVQEIRHFAKHRSHRSSSQKLNEPKIVLRQSFDSYFVIRWLDRILNSFECALNNDIIVFCFNNWILCEWEALTALWNQISLKGSDLNFIFSLWLSIKENQRSKSTIRPNLRKRRGQSFLNEFLWSAPWKIKSLRLTFFRCNIS